MKLHHHTCSMRFHKPIFMRMFWFLCVQCWHVRSTGTAEWNRTCWNATWIKEPSHHNVVISKSKADLFLLDQPMDWLMVSLFGYSLLCESVSQLLDWFDLVGCWCQDITSLVIGRLGCWLFACLVGFLIKLDGQWTNKGSFSWCSSSFQAQYGCFLKCGYLSRPFCHGLSILREISRPLIRTLHCNFYCPKAGWLQWRDRNPFCWIIHHFSRKSLAMRSCDGDSKEQH